MSRQVRNYTHSTTELARAQSGCTCMRVYIGAGSLALCPHFVDRDIGRVTGCDCGFTTANIDASFQCFVGSDNAVTY